MNPYTKSSPYTSFNPFSRQGMGFLLLENGKFLLQENLGKIIIQSGFGHEKQSPYTPLNPYV